MVLHKSLLITRKELTKSKKKTGCQCNRALALAAPLAWVRRQKEAEEGRMASATHPHASVLVRWLALA